MVPGIAGKLARAIRPGDQRAVGAAGDAAGGRRRAVAGPAVHRVQHGAEQHRSRHDVGEILLRRPRMAAWPADRRNAASSTSSRRAPSLVAPGRCPAYRCARASLGAPSIPCRSGVWITSGSVSGRLRMASRCRSDGRWTGVGEREAVGGVEVVLVLLACRRRSDWRSGGSAICGRRRRRAAACRRTRFLPGGVGVASAVDEVAHAAAGLRAAPGIGFLDAGIVVAQGCACPAASRSSCFRQLRIRAPRRGRGRAPRVPAV